MTDFLLYLWIVTCAAAILCTGCVTTGTTEPPEHESPAEDHMID